MEAARGDELPYGEPMKIPEHMDSTDLCPSGETEDDVRYAVRQWLEEAPADFDAAEFFEGIAPEGPFRYSGSFDAWDAIWMLVEQDPCLIAHELRNWIKDNGPMDPRKGPDQ